MAVLPDLPAVTVTIAVKSQDLTEYLSPDKPDESDLISRYVEAKSGQRFEVREAGLDVGAQRGDGLERKLARRGAHLAWVCSIQRARDAHQE